MYDIKSIEFGRKADNKSHTSLSNYFDHYQQISADSSSNSSSRDSSISTIKLPIVADSQGSKGQLGDEDTMQVSLRRRRIFQRQACLLSILAAFILGLTLGVFMPMMSGISGVFMASGDLGVEPVAAAVTSNRSVLPLHPPSDFPTIYELHGQELMQPPTTAPSIGENPFSVSFIKEKDLPAEEVFRNAFHLEQDKLSEDAMIVKKLDASDGSIKEFRVQRTSDGLFRKGPEKRLSKPSVIEQMLPSDSHVGPNDASISFLPIAEQIVRNAQSNRNGGIVESDIYWGSLVEEALPKGFSKLDATSWNNYVHSGIVTRLETGCGRMQNRLVVFADGTRACARYRQNTDQIQGELFSFYLGQLLNLTNLAPSAASVIDLDSPTWSNALQDITNSQWKSTRPVVLTKWLPDLEPAGIPQPFQPLERHLNKYDVWNITLGTTTATASSSSTSSSSPSSSSSSATDQDANQKGLLKRLGAAVPSNIANNKYNNWSSRLNQSQSAAAAATAAAAAGAPTPSDPSYQAAPDRDELHLNATVLNRLIELAQWSDLIVFDYLIANLDRVVNNLYNYQWNADIMAAPAHNLARQTNSQLLVFLDNESGLLHGYRLLKKYEAYHGLLLDNLCVFRRPTIEALKILREYGPGKRLQELFERSTSHQIRDVLPSLPDKSIKILIDRIDRVLGQVQKCRDLFSDR